MSNGMKVLVGLGAGVSLLALVLVFSVLGIFNDCVRQEADIRAQYSQNKNNYDNGFKKVKEVAQVPEMYTQDLQKVYNSAIKTRYGKEGSKALFQFLKEQNPNFDASLYKQVQQVIESMRLSFEANQTTLLDKKRIYEQTLNTMPGGAVAKLLGFPRLNLADFDIVTSEETESTFQSKKSEPIKLR